MRRACDSRPATLGARPRSKTATCAPYGNRSSKAPTQTHGSWRSCKNLRHLPDASRALSRVSHARARSRHLSLRRRGARARQLYKSAALSTQRAAGDIELRAVRCGRRSRLLCRRGQAHQHGDRPSRRTERGDVAASRGPAACVHTLVCSSPRGLARPSTPATSNKDVRQWISPDAQISANCPTSSCALRDPKVAEISPADVDMRLALLVR